MKIYEKSKHSLSLSTSVFFYQRELCLSRKLHAFIWDSPRLEYEAALDCDLVTAGELFGRSTYAIALRKKDPWINPLSHAILSLHEKGLMELLDNQWIFSKQFVESMSC